MSLDELPLHDAVLSAVHINWETARGELELRPVGSKPHSLVFEEFVSIELPRRETWGRSASVNAARQIGPGLFEIELQSGDILRIEAPRWTYVED